MNVGERGEAAGRGRLLGVEEQQEPPLYFPSWVLQVSAQRTWHENVLWGGEGAGERTFLTASFCLVLSVWWSSSLSSWISPR